MLHKVDSTLSKLSNQELDHLRVMIQQAIYDQPAHDAVEFNPAMAYELSVINWDICNDLAGRAHLFDEWFSGIPV